MIKAILFDLGGVLFTNGTRDFSIYLAKKYKLEIDKVNHLLNESDVGNAYREGKISREFFWNSIKKTLNINESIDILEDQWINNYQLIEGTKKIILELSKKYKIYFLSDNVKERVDKINTIHNFITWFESGIFSHEVGVRKPHPKIYELAVKKIKFKPEEIVFIDDKEKNLEPAKKLGMKVIHFVSPEKLHADLASIFDY